MKPKNGQLCLIQIYSGEKHLAVWSDDEGGHWVCYFPRYIYFPDAVIHWWDLSLEAAKSYKP